VLVAFLARVRILGSVFRFVAVSSRAVNYSPGERGRGAGNLFVGGECIGRDGGVASILGFAVEGLVVCIYW